MTLGLASKFLRYERSTGEFFWLVNKGRDGKAGARAGALTARGYIEIGLCGRTYLAHRLAWFFVYGAWPKYEAVDHINGNKGDNRIENLRDVSDEINAHNVFAPRSDNRTGLRGVFPNKKRFSAQIQVRGVAHHLGTFDTPEEAHQVYMQAKARLHVGAAARAGEGRA